MHLRNHKSLLLFAFCFASLLLHLTPAAAQSWSNGYAERRTITIDHTKVPNTDQTNFPVLISGTYSDLATTGNGGSVTNASGYDIVFTSDSNGTSILAFERETYNSSTGAVNFWVRVPTLSHSTDTVIYMFYGDSSVTSDQSNKTGVWDSNYKGVWHLGDGSTVSGSDSTSDGYTLTNNNSTAAVAGKIGGAAIFNGSNNYLSNSSLSVPAGSSLTISFWNYVTSSELQSAASFTVGGAADPNRISADVPSSDSNVYWDYGTWNGGGRVSTSYSSYLGSWAYVVLQYNSTGTTHSIYLNGSLAASTTNSDTPHANQTGIDIGAWPGVAYEKGDIDEFRVSTSARSADWIAAEYNNQSSPSTFYSVGSAESGGPIITSLSPTSGAVGTAVTITGTNFGSSQGSSTVTFNGTTASVTSWGTTSIAVTVPIGAITGNVIVTVSSNASNGENFTVSDGSSWSNSYGYRRALIIDHTKVPNTDQTNFPLLFSGTYAYLATTTNGGHVTNANGYDVIFTLDSSGTRPLNFEVESYSASTGNVSYWIKVPTVSHTVDTKIYMFYGNSAITTDQSNKNGVWDSNYQGVWHLDQTPSGSGSILDSTNNGFNGTPAGSGISLSSTGIAGGSLNFNGVSSANQVTFSASTPGGPPLTASIWIKTTGLNSTAQSQIMAKFQWSSNGWGIYDDGQYDANVFLRPYPNYNNIVDIPRSSINDGAWHYLTGTIDSSDTLRFYLDGSLYGSTTTSSITADTADSLMIGGFGGNAGGGLLTEARVSNTVRSADWIAAEYNNQSNPRAFYDEGSPFITSLSSTSVHYEDSITITGKNFGSAQGSSTVTFSGTPATVTSWSATSIVVTVPVGVASGNVLVTVAGVASNLISVNVFPAGWFDQDVGSVGVAGSATYANGIFTIKGAGGGIGGTADAAHFVYAPLSGDGTIVARLVSLQGSGTYPSAGVMIRETLAAGSALAAADYVTTNGGYYYWDLFDRTSTGGSASGQQGPGPNLIPYWIKIVRSGNTFTVYTSANTVDWAQLGTPQTISMATNVDVGLFVSNGNTTSLATATFDNLSITTPTVPAPIITEISATTGSSGTQVVITGEHFGVSQSGSLVTLGALPTTINLWSDTSILMTIPAGATSGYLVVSVAPSMNNSNAVYFTITAQPLPFGWLDSDAGSVGAAGSATYANGVYTIKGAGGGIGSTTDAVHFVYVPLSGDGTIVARLVSLQGSGTYPSAGVMIRETLAAGSTLAAADYTTTNGGYFYWYLFERTSTGGSSSGQQGPGPNLIPYWIKIVRSGNTFTTYTSANGLDWTQLGTPQTISMATNVDVGLFVSNGSTTSLATATFDNVSITTPAVPAPVISSLSATTGPIGSQVVISGANFGDYQGDSVVLLNATPVIINSWSATSIVVTIPTGATTGYLVVAVAPSMNDSNAVVFTITSQPLPPGWLDSDVGNVSLPGNATYADGEFTLQAAGNSITSIGGTADSFHFAYQPLSGDGTIIARLVSLQGGGNYHSAGVMIRETLGAGSTHADVDYVTGGGGSFYWSLVDRTSTGGSTSTQTGPGPNLIPYWIKIVRSGTTFTGYTSVNGSDWTQLGTSQTIGMATNVDIGLVVTGDSTTSLATAVFDNVSITTPSLPAPIITDISATTGSIGSQVVITGEHFGASQGGSLVTLSALPMTINAWSDTSITFTVPSGAGSGILVVSVAPSMNDSNPIYFTVTTQSLPSGWLDSDVGSVGVTGSAGYINGTFTIQGAGGGLPGSTADGFHFVYESLSGDGTIVARVASGQNGTTAGVMIRETLDAGSTYASVSSCQLNGYPFFCLNYRATTGAAASGQVGLNASPPYWVKISRSGNTFIGYTSPDGVYWTQIGPTETISMATNVDIGLIVSSNSTSSLATATFDNVAVAAGSPLPTPIITGISPTFGGTGATVTVTGSNFGTTQGSSSVRFNGAPASSITSWSATQVVAVVPSTAGSGPLTVVASGIGSNRNFTFTFYNPVVSGLTPSAAPTGGYVTLNGSGFGANQGSSQLQFNGITATINSWSDTSVTATVPANATSGSVTVTVGGVTSNGTPFTLLGAMSVSSIAPASGAIGSSVTINGSGFGPAQSNSTVGFYGANATAITSWSDTQIVVAVPPDAATGPLSVTVAGISAQSSAFTITFEATTTDSLGNQSTYAGELVGGQWVFTDSQGSGCSTCTTRGLIHKTYDSSGNVLSSTDSLGHVTTYTYDALNNLLSEAVTVNSTTTATTSYTYNTFGEVLTMIDPLGNTTTNAYDSHGNLTSVTSPAPNSTTAASVTQFAYDSKGELTQITDPLNHVTTMTYTAAGLIATITDAQNKVTTYGYDARGNRTSVTDALSHQTTFAYDAGNRLTTITYPDLTTSSFTYDTRGRRTSATDQNSKTTTYAYDDADRLTSVTDAAQNVTQYAYDTEDNLVTITDANSRSTFFTYDAFGRVTNTNFPSSQSETYAYDANNNLTSKTDRKNQTITYVYDALNRLTQKTYPDTTSVEYTYDLVGKILQVNDPTGTYAFAYDNMGRLIGTTTSYSFLTSRSFTNAYAYDAASNRTGFTDPEGGATTYAYDSLNRLATLAPPAAFGSGSFGFSYDALSRRTQMTRPNGIASNYSYDNLSRLLSVLHQAGSTTLDGSSYTVDNAGNRTAKTDQLASVTTNYGYDSIYQLLSATQGGSTTESYTYDPVGNRLSSLGVSSYTSNSSNELTATSNASYTYDSNGNETSKTDSTGTTSYSWDFENRLTQVTLPGTGGTVQFRYDPFGRRIEKISPTTTSIFAYDGPNLIETVNATGGVVARYTQGQNIDEPLAESQSGTVSYYEQDGLGSVTSLTNAAGALAQTYTYDSFGNTTNSSGSLANPFRYTGREFDTETGLYYYRARYYDPTTGRFLSEDRPNTFSDMHGLYPYVLNNPVVWTDPTGLVPAPPGAPPVPVPGGGPGNGWKWNPDPGNPRGGTWGPQTPIPGQGQPTGSWDPDGHWDVDNGKGDRQRYDPDGNPITPQQAHPRCDNNWWQRYRQPILIGGAVVIGATAIALAPVTGGQSLWVFAAAP